MYGIDRQTQALGLDLQQPLPYTVHADPLITLGDRGTQGDQAIIGFEDFLKGQGTVLAAAPGLEQGFLHRGSLGSGEAWVNRDNEIRSTRWWNRRSGI
jgi:hypothetical protein